MEQSGYRKLKFLSFFDGTDVACHIVSLVEAHEEAPDNDKLVMDFMVGGEAGEHLLHFIETGSPGPDFSEFTDAITRGRDCSFGGVYIDRFGVKVDHCMLQIVEDGKEAQYIKLPHFFAVAFALICELPVYVAAKVLKKMGTKHKDWKRDEHKNFLGDDSELFDMEQ